MKNKSLNFGIISIILAFLSPMFGIIFGIIGLSVKKEENKEKRDKAVNIFAIFLNIIMWIIYFMVMQ